MNYKYTDIKFEDLNDRDFNIYMNGAFRGFFGGVLLTVFFWTCLFFIEYVNAQSVQMGASVELTEANAFSTCVQEQCGHLK